MSHYDEERAEDKIKPKKIIKKKPAKKTSVKKNTVKSKAQKEKKNGPYLTEIDYTKLDAMCAIHCTGEECSAILGMDYDTLNRRLKQEGHGGFTDYFKIKGSAGKMSLRRKQYDLAMTGNPTMLIWLGKQWLEQTEKSENKEATIVDDLAASVSKLIDKLPN